MCTIYHPTRLGHHCLRLTDEETGWERKQASPRLHSGQMEDSGLEAGRAHLSLSSVLVSRPQCSEFEWDFRPKPISVTVLWNITYICCSDSLQHDPCLLPSQSGQCVCMHAKLLQSCLTLCNPMDSSPPGASVHGIFQAIIFYMCSKQVATLSSRGSFPPRDRTHISYVSCIGRWVLYH